MSNRAVCSAIGSVCSKKAYVLHEILPKGHTFNNDVSPQGRPQNIPKHKSMIERYNINM
jgi:hypothetical protein